MDRDAVVGARDGDRDFWEREGQMRVSSSSSSSTFLRSVVLGDDILGVRQKRLKSERECRRRVVHSKFLYYLYSFCVAF